MLGAYNPPVLTYSPRRRKSTTAFYGTLLGYFKYYVYLLQWGITFSPFIPLALRNLVVYGAPN